MGAFRLGGGGGSGAGLITGEERKAVGDGIVMVSIVITSCMGAWTRPMLEEVPVADRRK